MQSRVFLNGNADRPMYRPAGPVFGQDVLDRMRSYRVAI